MFVKYVNENLANDCLQVDKSWPAMFESWQKFYFWVN